MTNRRPADGDSAAPVPIQHHSFLSDQRTGAIVTPDARVVWLCAPRIDSSPIFAELLGGPEAGYFAVRPAEPGRRPVQRYLGPSMVLETYWGALRLTDYLDCSEGLAAEPAERVRLVRVVSGTGRAVIEFAPRAGPLSTFLEGRDGEVAVIGGFKQQDRHSPHQHLRLRSPGVAWEILQDGMHDTARAEVDPAAGPVVLELCCGPGASDVESPEPDRREATVEHWSGWADRLALPPVETELARRSALVLKALCHGPTGAILAAPTTSLPQCLSGARNWDYRYCWMRDASMAAATLVRLGSTTEAMDLLDWLLRLIDGGAQLDRLAPIYTVDGGPLPPETEATTYSGYGGSRPVRIGNAAEQQIQTDVFGPIMELLWRLAQDAAPLAERHWRLIEQLISAVEQRWQDPDQGIWELRAPPRHHVHSKTACWMAVDRATSIARTTFHRAVPEWEILRGTIATQILEQGWNPAVGAFTTAYGSTELDSSVLVVGLSGLVAPDDPRLAATVEAIEGTLRQGTGVYRYRSPDGLPGKPGAFNLMTSWLIDAKILIGDLDGARALFADLVTLAGPTGLLSEEHDPVTGLALGNFPQAYSHLGLIENACNLAEARSRRT